MHDEIDALLLGYIPTPPARVSTSELQSRLASSGHALGARAVQKRLDALLDRQIPLVRDDRSKPFQWTWKAGAKEQHVRVMPPSEALSLLLAREHLRALLPPPTLAWIDAQVATIEKKLEADVTGHSRSWRSKVRRVPNDLPRIVPDVSAAVFKAVSEALYESLQLSFEYRKRFSSEPTSYVVDPLGLCERDGELWLAAKKVVPDSPGDPLRFFLLHRMRGARVLRGRPARKHPANALDAAVRAGLTHFPLELGDSVALVARFHAQVIEKLDESRIARDQTIEPIDAEWFRLRATVPHTRALMKFLLGYGALCVVESPRELRAMIADEHDAAAAAYRR